MKILIATQNQNKLIEIKSMFSNTKISFVSLKDLNDLDEVDETGETFLENALLKAKHFSKKYHMVCLADDSGLAVDYLKGAPGVYSSRYSGKGDEENVQLVLRQLQHVSNRKAQFICQMVLYYPSDDYKTFLGVLEGLISEAPKGKNGFGYDPIFYLESHQKTIAELDFSVKNSLSHRAIALHKVVQYLESQND